MLINVLGVETRGAERAKRSEYHIVDVTRVVYERTKERKTLTHA